MVKFREASPGAAYEVAIGVTDAEEAAKMGLAVVESTPEGRPAAYGRYKGAPDGGPLGITVDKSTDTEVVAGGGVSPGAADATGPDKGDFVNVDDPFVHGGTGEGSIHADGAEPGKLNEDLDHTAERDAAKASLEPKSTRARK